MRQFYLFFMVMLISASIRAFELSTTEEFISGISVAVFPPSESVYRLLTAVSQLTVVAVEISEKFGTVVLQSAKDGSTVFIRVLPEIAADLSKSIGSTVDVAAEPTGYVFTHSGRLIGFIPNDPDMTHHSQVPNPAE